jgi:hypothetical protein
MSIEVTPFLRNVLFADAAMGAVAAAATILGAGLLSPLLGLPQPLLFWAGVALVPIAAFLFVMARRNNLPRGWQREIVFINALWTAASVGLLVPGLVQPNALGVAFVLAQAAAVGLFALLEALPLRAAPATA